MAQLTREEFTEKYDRLFADNSLQNAGPETLREFRDDIRDSFALRTEVNAGADSPAVKFDTTTRLLTAMHALGTAELEYSHDNGEFLPYEEVQVNDLTHAQGEWRYRVRATGGRNTSAPTDSPKIAPKTVAATLTVAFSVTRTTLTSGQSLNFTASASGGKAPYSHVVTATEQQSGQVLQLGSAATKDYTSFWKNAPVGTYDLVDTLSDAAGSQQASLTRTVRVTAPIVVLPNTPPTVTLTVTGTTSVPRFTAKATDADGIKSIRVNVYAVLDDELVATFGPSAAGNTQYVTSWAAASAGDYYAQAVASDTKDLPGASERAYFTVQTETPTTGVLVLAATHLVDNLYDEDYSQYAPGLRRRSPLYRTKEFTVSTAGTIQLRQYSDLQYGVLGGYVRLNDGNPIYLTNSSAGYQNFPLQVAAGDRVRYYAGNAQWPNNLGQVFFGGLLQQIDWGSVSYSIGNEVLAANALYVCGDSITVEIDASAIGKGWVTRLRTQLGAGWAIATDSAGYQGVIAMFSPQGAIAAFVQRVRAFHAGRTGRKIVLLDCETNCYGIVPGYGSAANYKQVLGLVIDALLADDPSYEIWIKTATARYDKTGPNEFDNVLAQYSAQALALRGTRPGLLVHDASQWLSQADLNAGKLHPTDAGYGLLAGYFYSLIFPSGGGGGTYTQRFQTFRSQIGLVRNTAGLPTSGFAVAIRWTAQDVTTAYQQLVAKATVDSDSGNVTDGSLGVYQHLAELHGSVYGASGSNSVDVLLSSLVAGSDYVAVFNVSASATSLYLAPNGGTGAVRMQPGNGVANVQASTDKLSIGGVRKINPSGIGNLLAGFMDRVVYFTQPLTDAQSRALLANGGAPTAALASLVAVDTDLKTQPGGSTAQNFAVPANVVDIVPATVEAGPAFTATKYGTITGPSTPTAAKDFVLGSSWGTAGDGRAFTKVKDDPATFSFTGSQLQLNVNFFPNAGILRLVVDGELVAPLDLLGAEEVLNQPGYLFTWPGSGAHTISLEVDSTSPTAAFVAFTAALTA